MHATAIDDMTITMMQGLNKKPLTTEDTTTMPNKGQSPHPTMPEIKINTIGVIKLLKSINPHTTTGPDNILRCFLMLLVIMCSNTLQQIAVKDTGL
jgi:hypothetical protein